LSFVIYSFEDEWNPLQQKMVNAKHAERAYAAAIGANIANTSGSDSANHLNNTKASMANSAHVAAAAAMALVGDTNRTADTPAGMVLIPQANYSFSVWNNEIEGKDSVGSGNQYPWEHAPQREHKATLQLGPYYIGRYPVTCANYSTFLDATGYSGGADAFNWLLNWDWGGADGAGGAGGADSADSAGGAGRPGIVSVPKLPLALEDVPVTYVGIEEARAYCKWAYPSQNGRLPHR
jgi:formylglycine-generating enzyme required for sulfatase activity